VIQDPLLVLAFMLGVVAFTRWLEERFEWVKKISSAVVCTLLGIAFANLGVIEHTAMVSKLTASDYLAREMTPSELQNLANYFVRVPSEVGMTLFSAIAQGDNGPANISEFYALTADTGASVQEHVSEVL
jgi:hypothetical protein